MDKIKEPLVHIALWLSYVLFAVVFNYSDEFWLSFYETSVSNLISAGIFYFNALYILPRFLERRRYIPLLSLELSLYLLSTSVKLIYGFVIDPIILGEDVDLALAFTYKPITVITWQWYLAMLASTLYWYKLKSIRFERMLRLQERMIAEQKHIELQNAALRAQINPHFFVNTLNGYVHQCELEMPQLAADLRSLITVLKAAIAETDDDGLTPLSKEIEVVDSLYRIQKGRYKDCRINYSSILEAEEQYRILPHALSTIVENAYKHGEFMDPERPLTIDMSLIDGDLNLRVHNWKCDRVLGSSKGIGLPFITRHLASTYGDRHNLVINNLRDEFEVVLVIKKLDPLKLKTVKAA